MPHLPPIEINGGSVSIKFPAQEGTDQRIRQDGESVHNPASQSGRPVTVHEYADSQPGSRIYLIEIQGTGPDPLYFTPNQNGKCSVRIHYLSETEIQLGEKPEFPPGAKLTPLG